MQEDLSKIEQKITKNTKPIKTKYQPQRLQTQNSLIISPRSQRFKASKL